MSLFLSLCRYLCLSLYLSLRLSLYPFLIIIEWYWTLKAICGWDNRDWISARGRANNENIELRQDQRNLLHLIPAQPWLDISATVRRTRRNILNLGTYYVDIYNIHKWYTRMIWSHKILIYRISIPCKCWGLFDGSRSSVEHLRSFKASVESFQSTSIEITGGDDRQGAAVARAFCKKLKIMNKI